MPCPEHDLDRPQQPILLALWNSERCYMGNFDLIYINNHG